MNFKNATQKEKKEQIEKWANLSIEQLSELVSHNESVLKSHQISIDEVNACQKEILAILDRKECEVIRDKINDITEEEREKMLNMIPHSPDCEVTKSKFISTSYTGFNSSYNPPRIICPHCALKYVLESPWLDIDFTMSVEFDFSHYNGGI